MGRLAAMSNPFNVAKEGSVASRFVAASDPQETKAAEEYDPRSLFEVSKC